MYLIRELTKVSLVDIGKELGNRDHTTIMHGLARINREIDADSSLRTHITQIREALLTG
jgi:chromosomal replication initiator protein